MNIDKLRIMFEASSTKYDDCKTMGTTYQNMHNILYKGSGMRVELLEKIAQFYSVPVGYFFDEATVEAKPSQSDKKETIRLQGMVEAYERAFALMGKSKKS